MKLFVLRVILFVVCSITVGYFLSKIVSSVPIVYWSTSKDECVKVIIFDKNKREWVEKGCNDIPKKHERIWVK